MQLCGMSPKKQSSSGCTCSSPCKFKLQCTKMHQKSDMLAYLKLKDVPPSPQYLNQIDKDLHRTYQYSATFSKNRLFREMLREVLVAYSVYDLELGYVQGINNIAAVLLFHIKNAEQTFWALVELMEYQQLRMIYLGKLEYLEEHCKRIKKLVEERFADLYRHADRLGVDLSITLHGWVLSLMTKVVPLQDMHILLDSFRKHGWPFFYRFILCLFKTLNNCLLLCDDQADFLTILTENNVDQGLDWRSLLK